MDTTTKPRANDRWPTSLAADLATDDRGLAGRVRNLSLGGAFVACPAALSVGAGLRLSFRLPNGMPVIATGRVVWVQAQASATTPAGAGVEFYGLDDVTREILRNYFATEDARESVEHDGVRIEEKFRVESDHDERVYLRLVGFLDKRDCASVAHAVNEVVRTLKSAGVRLCVNVTGYQCCAPEGLEHFKKSFAALAGRAWLVGALVGPKSLGMMQMRRAARDANVADSFASFDAVDEALEFLETVEA